MDSDIVFRVSISENQLRDLVYYLTRASTPRVEYTEDNLEMTRRALRASVTNAVLALDMVLKFNGGIWEDEMQGWIMEFTLPTESED